MDSPKIVTERIVLRTWLPGDSEPFAAMNADAEVMEHFPSPLGHSESDQLIDRIMEEFERNGFGLWAIELRDEGRFAGFTGLSVPGFEAHFTPAVEVGWRLARWSWCHGYATEAATAALDFGFVDRGLKEIVSFTSVDNVRSQAVMRRLGMTSDPAEDFDHPSLPPGHRLRRHVLYRISRQQWLSRGDAPVSTPG